MSLPAALQKINQLNGNLESDAVYVPLAAGEHLFVNCIVAPLELITAPEEMLAEWRKFAEAILQILKAEMVRDLRFTHLCVSLYGSKGMRLYRALLPRNQLFKKTQQVLDGSIVEESQHPAVKALIGVDLLPNE